MYSAYLSSCHSSDCQPKARAGNQKLPPEIVDINTVSGMSSNTSIKDMDIPGYVKMILKDELQRSDKFLSEEDLKYLLDETNTHSHQRKTIYGYPSSPLYRDLGTMLALWIEKRACPVLDLPKYDMLDEKTYVESRLSTFTSITPLLTGLPTLWDSWGVEERKYRIRDVMVTLEKRGLMDLFGIRNTIGTQEIFPPPRKVMEEAFTKKHSPNAELCVGARALAKHHHRDQTSSWWGNCTGNESDKNKNAVDNMNKVLDNATWINIHWLPQDVIILEARHPDGYGARWSPDGLEFRGFLEPQMVDGHVVGWRH